MEWHRLSFWVGTLYPFPFWALMILMPHSKWTEKWMSSVWVIALPSLFYTGIVALHAPEAVVIFYKPSPELVAQTLSQPWAGSLFWVYAAGFDLFVGRWMYFDSREQSIHPMLVSPFLFVAIFFGPIGFLGYLLVRSVAMRARKEPTG